MKYAFIAERKNTYPVDRLCRLLGVKRNGFYRYMKTQHQPTTDDDKRKEIVEWMHKIAKASEHSYGSRRMQKALNCLGYPIGRRLTRRLMKEAGVQVRYKKNIRSRQTATTRYQYLTMCSTDNLMLMHPI